VRGNYYSRPYVAQAKQFALTGISRVQGILENDVPEEHIVAVGLLTRHDLDMLGESFKRLWTVDEVPCFRELLEAIDAADVALQRQN